MFPFLVSHTATMPHGRHLPAAYKSHLGQDTHSSNSRLSPLTSPSPLPGHGTQHAPSLPPLPQPSLPPAHQLQHFPHTPASLSDPYLSVSPPHHLRHGQTALTNHCICFFFLGPGTETTLLSSSPSPPHLSLSFMHACFLCFSFLFLSFLHLLSLSLTTILSPLLSC